MNHVKVPTYGKCLTPITAAKSLSLIKTMPQLHIFCVSPILIKNLAMIVILSRGQAVLTFMAAQFSVVVLYTDALIE